MNKENPSDYGGAMAPYYAEAKEVSEAFKEARAMALGLCPLIEDLRRMVKDLNRAELVAKTHMHRSAFGKRPPGSMKTRRLRKKRTVALGLNHGEW